jgi:transaldolase
MANQDSFAALRKLGQSLWFDDLHRGLLESGRLAAMVREDGLSGVTSNPAIFEKAIAGSERYDAAIRALVASGESRPEAICEQLMLADVRGAADALYPVFERSRGADGYVSLEVSPALAHDAGGTVAEARRLAHAVQRPNLMIKVPATPAGIEAIRRLVGEGLNVNATLIFSTRVCAAVAEAYIEGLADRAAAGGDPGGVAGVASFFISRIDTAVDARLERRMAGAADPAARQALHALLGLAAIAIARLAYQDYLGRVQASRWRALAAAGARPQRLLWASTGTKNPAWPKTRYVDELIGPDTVITMPEATYEAFRRCGQPSASLTREPHRARQVMLDLANAGISIEEVAGDLLVEGLRLFAQAQERLLAAVARKRHGLR